MRISIIGFPGSGKTTLAKAISIKLSIRHIHLDRFWFEAGGTQGSKSTPPEKLEKIRAHIRDSVLPLIAQDEWVSDGFHSGIQPEIAERANVLIFLDIPLGERLRNHFWRMFEHTSRHKELSIWDDMTFFIEIIQRALRKKTKYLELLGQYPKKAIVLRSRKEIDSYLNSL